MEARITVKIEEMGYCDEWIKRVEQNNRQNFVPGTIERKLDET